MNELVDEWMDEWMYQGMNAPEFDRQRVLQDECCWMTKRTGVNGWMNGCLPEFDRQRVLQDECCCMTERTEGVTDVSLCINIDVFSEILPPKSISLKLRINLDKKDIFRGNQNS